MSAPPLPVLPLGESGCFLKPNIALPFYINAKAHAGGWLGVISRKSAIVTEYQLSSLRQVLLWVKCRLAEEAAVTAGVPQKAADFAAMPQSAGAGHEQKFCVLRMRYGYEDIATSGGAAGLTASILHIVFNQSAAGSLRQALRDAGREDGAAGYFDNLALGPVNPLDVQTRLHWVEEELQRGADEWWGTPRRKRFGRQPWSKTFAKSHGYREGL